uniref:Uncharacterized protein n=1 Tax=Cyprinus carpio TaxID=7962 RepID=A0A8C1RS21_CYPCA
MVRTDQISSSPLSGENYLCFLFFKSASLNFFFRFFSLLLVLANGFSLLLFLTNSFLRVSLSDLGFL